MQTAFNSTSEEQVRYRSAAVARMVRIPVSTLRIWERRYQVVGPAQTATGHRLYSGADVERLLLIKQLTAQGHAIGSIARLPTAALLEVADARAALDQADTGAAGARPRLALVGRGLVRRLVGRALQRVGPWPDLAAADTALLASPGALHADLLLAELATLQPTSAEQLLALARRLGARRCMAVYGFGAELAAQRLRDAGWQLRRAPLADADLLALVDEACAALPVAPAVPPRTAPPPVVAPGPAAPHRFDDATLTQLAAASSTMACECPRHLAELVMLLGHFEVYSGECVQRSPSDAVLHAHLQQVAAHARALIEGALLRVVEAEGIPLPPAIAAWPAAAAIG